MSVQSAAADVDVDLRQLFASLARNWLRILVVALLVTGLAFASPGLPRRTTRPRRRLKIQIRANSAYTRPPAPTTTTSRFSTRKAWPPRSRSFPPVRHPQAGGVKAQSGTTARVRRRGRHVAVEPFSRHCRPQKRSRRNSAGRARAEEDAREAQRLQRRKDARHRHRILLGRSQACRRHPQRHRRRLHRLPGQGEDRIRTLPPPTFWGRKSPTCRQQVKDAEAKVATYRAQSDLLMGGNNSVLATQQLSELSSELSRCAPTAPRRKRPPTACARHCRMAARWMPCRRCCLPI